MKKIIGVYGIKVNGELKYVGSSKDCNRRKSNHLARLRKGKHEKQLQDDYDFFGEDSFSFEMLEECLVKDLYAIEANYIDRFPDAVNIKSIKNTTKKIRRGKEAAQYRDKRSKITFGTNNGHCLTEIETIILIKQMLSSGMRNKDIADAMDKSPAYVSRIRTGDRWKHVSVAS